MTITAPAWVLALLAVLVVVGAAGVLCVVLLAIEVIRDRRSEHAAPAVGVAASDPAAVDVRDTVNGVGEHVLAQVFPRNPDRRRPTGPVR